MKRLVITAALAAGLGLACASPATAAARSYDCSKPGNANKAACKGKAAPAAKPATAPKAAPIAKSVTTTKSVSRNYDCTKAGNANKAQCKSSTSVATSVAKSGAAPGQPSILQRMKNAMSGSPSPAAKPAVRRTASAAPASVEDHNPAGAIAQCKDGTYSHSKIRTGACSRHGGVGKWS